MRMQAQDVHSAARSTRPRTRHVSIYCKISNNNNVSRSLESPQPQPAKPARKLASIVLAAAVALSPLVPATDVAASEAVATSSAALELQQAYDKYSASYDELDGGAAADALGFPQLRAQLLAQARGRTLEVAVGTGLNLQYYDWAQPAPAAATEATGGGGEEEAAATAAASSGVTSLDTVDLSPGMLAQARARVRGSPGLAGRPIAFQQADVAALPYADSAFDTVVDTFSLCVFPDPQAAMHELARVVRPASGGGGGGGGRLLLLEHSRSDNPLLAAYQDATAGPVAALGKGCVWNQDVEAMAARAGLVVTRAERFAAGTVELLVAEKPAPPQQ
ncbi:hypothetical protein CHLRE_15g641875v5 [Chlamydomonas reinhardtii]|uniref:Methyltransferase type 11 domain-containing protein n=1 Tax=Chlamydomonas reinhardtii TaxID=3055 RepID=A0A2K3CWW9_CHLRE|nr:uncharacterized protein CHLRE_15g641875v5 [Chlamydomonas reinhardtii]PNW72776.1 hypothetical protein CHLRE_15g641875v5 [Chlamydomonas reinhardtii]